MRKELTGQKFNYLTALRFSHSSKGKALWVFQCDCGKTITTRGGDVTMGKSKSCGCKTSEYISASKFKHGLLGHPLYTVWSHIKDRCYNPNSKHFHRYGGRGITVCARWLNDFKAFYDDMLPLYIEGFSIDRVDNNGNYEPSNCRFADAKQQSLNKENNRRIDTEEWGSITISEASERTGIFLQTLYHRVNSKYKNKNILREPGIKINTPWGLLSRQEAAAKSGISYRTIKSRIQLGWPEDRLLIPIYPKRSKKP